jgi:small nuclear ribonucleoprotein (snRNP)-like protein
MMQKYILINFFSMEFLTNLIGKKILICLESEEKIKGKLIAFDSFLNLILKTKFFSQKKVKREKFIFIRGEKIVYLKFL